MARIPRTEKTSLLEFRRPMQESSLGRISVCQSEVDFTEEITMDEEDLALKMIAHDKNASKKFQRIAKGIQWQFAWSKDICKSNPSTFDFKEVESKNHSDIITFNRNLFKATNAVSGFLTSAVKTSLQKPQWEREKIDLERICALLVNIRPFASYPYEIKKQLPRIITYDVYENGETILQEGQFGISLFFIVSGSVLIEISQTDEKTGKLKQQVIREKIAGETFGEKFVIPDRATMAAVTSKRRSELLRLDKDDIEKVLKTSFRQERERRIKFLKSLQLFDQWVQSDIKLLNASSTVVEYAPNTVIVQDMRQPQDCAFFIMTGQCQVVRQLPVIIERLPFGREKFTLAPGDEIDELKENTKIDKRFESVKNLHLVIQMLKEGDFFCVEEDIGKSSVISISKTELLTIPKSNLLSQQRGSFYAYIHALAMKKYPDRVQTFQRYLRGRNWKLYKKDLVNEIARKRSGRLSACLHDVPKCLQEMS